MHGHPKVFISYSHQNTDYENKILKFSNKLRSEGIDANIDLYEEAPSEGWPRWMENQISSSDYVLVVCCQSYYNKCYLDEKGKGVSWEANIVYQRIYDAASQNNKFIPIFFNIEDEQYILTPLKPFTFYNVGTKEGFDRLCWRLRGVAKTQKPPLGKLRSLPEKERKTMFFSSPIDLRQWDEASWKGMIYLFTPAHLPILGLLYHNYPAAKEIFTEWKKSTREEYADKFIKVDFIVPPFPNGCWMYSDKERNYGKGYFVHIGPNIEESINRAKAAGLNPEELLVATVSRYQWMDELNGSKNREFFKQLTENGAGYIMMPIGIKDQNKPIEINNLIIDFSYSIKMKNAGFKSGIDVRDDDNCKVVLQKPGEQN
jgi:hypothetical protein